VRRLTTVLGADAGVSPSDALQLIAEAIDWRCRSASDEVRRVTVIANVAKELKNGDIRFEPVFRLDDQSPESQPSWVKVGDLFPRILAETSL
jgi:pilus assembly protein CpaF